MTTPSPGDIYRLTDGTRITVVKASPGVVVIDGEYDPPRRWWPWVMWDIYTLGAVGESNEPESK